MRRHSLRALVSLAASVSALIWFGALPAAGQPATPGPSVVWVDQFDSLRAGFNSVAVAGSAAYVAGVPQYSGTPLYVRRYTDAGMLQWAVALESTSTYAPALAADASRVCVGAATRPSAYPWQEEGLVQCLAPADGTTQATAYVETEPESYPSYPPSTRVTGIALSSDAVYVVGVTEGQLKGDCLDGCTAIERADGFVRKYLISTDGGLTPAWTRQVDLGGNFEGFYGAALDSSGNLRVWGMRQLPFPGGHYDAVLRCYDPNGAECGGSVLLFGNPYEFPFAATFGPDALYLVTLTTGGTRVSRYALGDGLTAGPSADWSVDLNDGLIYSLAAERGGVVLGGSMVVPGSGDSSDARVLRYADDGSLSWSLPISTPGNDNGFGVAADSSHVYVCGATTGSLVPGVVPNPIYVLDAFIARVARPDQPDIPDLITQILELPLKPGQAKSLIGKLEQAQQALDAGDTKKAVTMLEAFIHEVSAFRNAGILRPEDADDLIGIAEAIIEQISG